MIKKYILLIFSCLFVSCLSFAQTDDMLELAEKNRKELEKKRSKDLKKLKKTEMTKAEKQKIQQRNNTAKNINSNRKKSGQGFTQAEIQRRKFEKKRRKKVQR